MSYLRGIDVSHWQGTEPSHDGLAFELARATFGTAKDDKYDFHRDHARADGLAFGPYHFGDPSKTVADQVKAHLAATPGESCSILDIEAGNMSLANGIRFISGIHDAGRNAGLYMSASSYNWRLGQDFDYVASWMASPPAGLWEFWQYRGSPLDLDYYRGTKEQLFALLEGSDMGAALRLLVTADSNPFDELGTAKVKTGGFKRVRDDAAVAIAPGTDLGVVQRGIRVTDNSDIIAFNNAGELHYGAFANVTYVPLPKPVDDGYTKATQDAAVAAQKAADQAAIDTANAAAARAQADLRTAAGQERERIALARGNAEADTIRTT